MVTSPGDTLKLAFRTPDTVEARALAIELNAAGVNVQITGDYSDTAYPGLALGGMANKELWVAESDWAEARPIVSQWVKTHHPGDVGDHSVKPQFSLRAMLIAMTLLSIAVPLGQWGGFDAVAFALSFLFYLVIFVLSVRFAWGQRGWRGQDDAEDPDA
jgi:hypothetical protein